MKAVFTCHPTKFTLIPPSPDLSPNFLFIYRGSVQSTWLAGGRLTGADIQMSFPLEAAAARGGLDESYPKIMAYLKRIHARAGYKRALERGGEYSLLS